MTSPFDDVKKGESYLGRVILREIFCDVVFCLCLDMDYVFVFFVFGHVVFIFGHVFGHISTCIFYYALWTCSFICIWYLLLA